VKRNSRINKRKTTAASMTSGPITRQILAFAVPLMFGNIFQILYNTVDSIIVGRFVGTYALAAMGVTTPITNMAVFFFNGFSIGATVVIGHFFGARDRLRVHKAIETTMMLTFILCILFTAGGIWGQKYLLELMKTPADVFPQAEQYLIIYFAGASSLLIYNMVSGILRAVGDSVRPLYFLVITSVLNILLDFLFVVGLKWGIAGAAIATVIAEFTSAVLTLILLTNTEDIYKLVWKDLSIDRSIFGQIMAIGLPNAIQTAVTSFSNVFVQSYVNFFGANVMAGWAAYNRLDQFVMLPMQSMAMAATTFVSQNIGAADVKRANRGTKISIALTLIITFCIISILQICAVPAIRLFDTHKEVIEVGVTFVRVNMYFLLFNCINHVLAGALRGRGGSTAPMIIMLLSFVLFRQIYLYLITNFFINTPAAVGFGYPVGWMICAVIEVTYFFICWNKKEKTK
jgi:putative MATE family efflux protein